MENYSNTPASQQNEWKVVLAILGLLLGCLCLCALVTTALTGYGVMTINDQLNTETAIAQATQAARFAQSTSTAAVEATAQAGIQRTATAYAQTPLLVRSNFDRNTENWTVGKDDGVYGTVSRSVANGKYQWELSKSKGVFWSGFPEAKTVSDFYLTVEAQQRNGPDDTSSYGVVFRQTPANNHYYFGINNARDYYLALYYNEQWKILIGRTHSDAIKPRGVNTLVVIAEGSHFTFLINSQFVADVTDTAIETGFIGVGTELQETEETAAFEFDNFEVHGLVTYAGDVTPTLSRTSTATATALASPTSLPVKLPFTVSGRLAFQSGAALYTINADGSGLTQVRPSIAGTPYPNQANSAPSWSPSGERLVFQRFDSAYNIDIYTMNADGSQASALELNFSNDTKPDWSPDGKRIAFASDREGSQTDIYVMEANGANPTRLTTGPGVKTAPDWSPDNQTLAFMVLEANKSQIELIGLEGGKPKILIDGEDPAWSPDGQWIAYTSKRDGNREIYLVTPNGNKLRRLTQNLADDSGPAWSPDGQYIAFVSNYSGEAEIYLMKADGSQLTRLTYNHIDESNLIWGP